MDRKVKNPQTEISYLSYVTFFVPVYTVCSVYTGTICLYGL